MTIKLFVLLVLAALTVFANTGMVYGQRSKAVASDSNLINIPVKNFVREGQLQDLLTTLSLAYDVPVGVEISADEDRSRRYRVEVKDGRLADVMDQITGQDHRYQWLVQDGVLSVVPASQQRHPLVSEILATRLKNFELKPGTDCLGLPNLLMTAPEVGALIESHGMRAAGANFSGLYLPQLGRHFSLSVANLTVRQILDRIVKESPLARVWIISSDSSSRLLSIVVMAKPEADDRLIEVSASPALPY